MGMLDPSKHRDARSLDHSVLEAMRIEAVRRVVAGETQRSVAANIGVTFQTVCKWMRMYSEGGAEALQSSTAPGPMRKLSEQQLKRVRRIIVGKDPRQLNFGAALWSLPVVKDMIEKLFNVTVHAATVSRYLHLLGLTPQKPTRRAFQRNDEACQRWVRDEFPEIVAKARTRKAALLFADETGVHEDHAVGTTWAETGKTPEVRVSGMRRRVNVISAISPRGRIWFRCYHGSLTAGRFVDFLEALLSDVRGNIVLIVDQHPAHRAASVKQFVEENNSRLEMFFLPGYAPDLNPDEHVWSYLKSTFKRSPLQAGEDFFGRVKSIMSSIAGLPSLVRSFFRHPAVQYVRDALA
jgi:transposase